MLVGTMFIEVVRREVFSYSSIWGEEIVRYSFIYLAWIGAAAAVKERGHIRIDVLMHYVPQTVKALLYMFGDIVMFVVAVIALYWSWESVHVSGNSARSPTACGSARPWFLFAVPFGFALVIFRLTQSFLRDLADLRNGRPVYEGDKLFD
jgi:TRAP-type C4-dicarboxylate transport system permease small subunit